MEFVRDKLTLDVSIMESMENVSFVMLDTNLTPIPQNALLSNLPFKTATFIQKREPVHIAKQDIILLMVNA